MEFQNIMNEPYPGTQAVMRAISLLKVFSEEQPELNLNEIAQVVNLKKTTAFRLLAALESEGLVARGQRADTYCLGPEILTLAGRALRSHDLRSASRSALEWLAQQTGETATLEIRVHDSVLILDEVPGSHLLGVAPWIGTLWPLHATSTGKVILAYQSPDERREALQAPLAALTHLTIVNREKLNIELENIHRQGYATAFEEIEPGFVAIAAPVFRIDGMVAGAISIGGPAIRLTAKVVEELAGLVMQQAQTISYGLGYQPPNEE